MKKQSTKTLSFALLLAVLFSSCEKDPVAALPVPDENLQVSLNETYLPAAKIDSAIAIWDVAGTMQTIRLQATGNTLATSLANLKKSGAGTLTVQLYTQAKLADKPLQWEQRFSYTLNRNTPVKLAAPDSIKDPSWNPRVISRSEISGANATVIIAVRPEDAYFELKNVSPAITKRIEIVRSFYQNDTTAVVASRGWVGAANNLDGNGNLINRAHFQNLTYQIGNKPWNKYAIRASFYAEINPDRIYEMEFVQDKP